MLVQKCKRCFSFYFFSRSTILYGESIIISNFNAKNTYGFELQLPEELVEKLKLKDGKYKVNDQLYSTYSSTLKVEKRKASVRIDIKPLESFILKIK